jgi:hypothetical protein
VNKPYVFPDRPIDADRAARLASYSQPCRPHTPQEVLDRVLQDVAPVGIGAYYVAPEDIYGTTGVEAGWLLRPGSLCIGAHYSRHNRRWCINLLPMVTLWICLKGGRRP